MSLQYYLTVSFNEDIDAFSQNDENNETDINILPLLSILNNMRQNHEIQNKYLNAIDETNFKQLNEKHLINYTDNIANTQNYLENIDLGLRGPQILDKLDFAPGTTLNTSAIKINFKIKNMSSIALDIDGNNVIFNKVSVSHDILIY